MTGGEPDPGSQGAVGARPEKPPQPAGVLDDLHDSDDRKRDRAGIPIADANARPTTTQLATDPERLPGSPLALEDGESGPLSTAFSGLGLREGVEASAQVDGCLLEYLGTDLASPHQTDLRQGRNASAVHRPDAPSRL